MAGLKKRRQRKKSESERTDGKKSRISVHPLFLLLGVWYSMTGKAGLFFVSVAAALLHEAGHSLVAARLGYKAERIELLPCGAVLKVNTLGISPADEILLAAGGPLVNLCCTVCFFALWWFLPDTYAYTDTAAYLSLFLAVVNLLPFFPLDGGRVLCALLSIRLQRERAVRVCKIITAIGAASLLGIFFYLVIACRAEWNVTVLFFAGFLTAGCFPDSRNTYRKWNFALGDSFKRGLEVRRIAVDEACTVKKAIAFLRADKYLLFDVYGKDGEKKAEITQSELWTIFEKGNLYSRIYEGNF